MPGLSRGWGTGTLNIIDWCAVTATPRPLPRRPGRAAGQRQDQRAGGIPVTSDLDTAKDYLKERYAEHQEARYGLVASAKDRDLVDFGIPNDFQSTKRINFGPWYSDPEEAYGR